MPRLLSKTVLASAAGLALLPAGAMAASPTIAAGPNPTTSGDPVVIYGTAKAGAEVVLWHRINPASRFTIISRTKADAAGRYEFTRADGVVKTNRNWYVRVAGQRSSTVHERVSAIVTATGPTSPNLTTNRSYAFQGTVSPTHAGDRVELQRQTGSGATPHWTTIDAARITRSGAYAIGHRFSAVGDANLRVHLPADHRNVASDSEILPYEVSQKQRAGLTIASSVDPLVVGGSTTISGTVAGVTAPTTVTLYGHVLGRAFSPVATVRTDAAGHYVFAPQAPIANTVLQVRGNGTSSAVLYQGVKDAVTAAVDQTSVTAGATVTFTGTVSPDKTGHTIVLERQNASGHGFHVVQTAKVGAGSTYAIARRLTEAGTKVFRVVVPGGPVNQSAASAPITIGVAANATPLS